MKKILSLAVSAMLASSLNISAVEINVTPEQDLAEVIEGIMDGDVVVLADGTYDAGDAGKTITINKGITIKATNAGGAILNKYQFAVEANAVVTDIVLDGFVAKYDKDVDSKYFFQANTGNTTVGSLTIKNCVVEGYGRGVLRSTTAIDEANGKPGDVMDNILVENSVFINNSCASAGYSQLNTQRVKAKTIKVKNCTFYESKAALIRYENANDVAIDIENCSIINCGSSSSRNMIEIGSSVGENTIINVKNCIFTGTFDTAPEKPINLQNKGNIDNTLLEGYASGDLAIKANITSPVEASVSSFDFSALTINTTPATVEGIGDSRWILNGKTNNINSSTADKNIIRTEYYDVTGRQTTQYANGIIIEKRIFDDGTTNVVKTIK